jgi:hypothetical protein
MPEALRAGFLADVPEHADLRAMARAAGIDETD